MSETITESIEQFHDPEGRCFNGISRAHKQALLELMKTEVGISSTRMEELASFSLAMVIRYALGLTAADGAIGVLVNDSFEGRVALAGARQLINAGAKARVFQLGDGGDFFRLQQKPLQFLGVQEIALVEASLLIEALPSLHNLIIGIDEEAFSSCPFADHVLEGLNDTSTPLHCIEAPLGVNRETGERRNGALFASSTLSLGIPYVGLRAASDHLGRHYICDIGIPGKCFSTIGVNDVTSLFHAQPVVQVQPLSAEKLTT